MTILHCWPDLGLRDGVYPEPSEREGALPPLQLGALLAVGEERRDVRDMVVLNVVCGGLLGYLGESGWVLRACVGVEGEEGGVCVWEWRGGRV